MLVARPVAGSSLVVPASGAPDVACAGSTVAEPLSPLEAQFANPAGLAGFGETAAGSGLGLAYGRGVVSAQTGAGQYHADNSVIVPFLDGFAVLPWGRWTFGVSVMGTSGARFDYGPRPAVGIDKGFFSESSIFAVPIGAAYRLSDTLWLGAEISPLYGSTHLRFDETVAEAPAAPTYFRYTVSGLGVQGMVGITWRPVESWSFGLSVKPPGRIWTDGNTEFQGEKQNVDLDLEWPMAVSVGVKDRITPRWALTYGASFVQTSVLATSYMRYEKTPSANSPFLPDARDEWHHALGIDYAWSDAVKVFGGLSWANGIVGNRGVTPLSYDSQNDVRLSIGARRKTERWVIDGSFAYIFAESHHVTADQALMMPGGYNSKPAYLLSILLTRKF
ncbi:MAG TPA: outer membrane protein transport protein [Candidatus Binatia bacterium]